MKTLSRLSPRTGETEQLRLQLNEVLAEYARTITRLEQELAAYKRAVPELIFETIAGSLLAGAGISIFPDYNNITITFTSP